MAWIYKITNKENNKVYIGKTECTVAKRFAEHKQDYLKRRNENRPLYSAMRKYGVDSFVCEALIESSTPEEDEIRLIEEYSSYSNGYNATLGGDGKKYINLDMEAVIADYNETVKNTVKALAEKYSVDPGTMTKLLKSSGVDIRSAGKASIKGVQQISSETGEVLNIFESASEAARVLDMTNGSHITKCAKGKRNTAGGFCWEYIS